MADQIVSNPDHGDSIIKLNGSNGVASPRLQLFHDDIQRIINENAIAIEANAVAIELIGAGGINPSDFDPSSVIFKPSTGNEVFPAIIDEKEFLGRLEGGQIEGLGFVDSWSILGDGTADITINEPGNAVDFEINTFAVSPFLFIDGASDRMGLSKGGFTSPTDGVLHIHQGGTTGPVTALTGFDHIVLEGPGNVGLSILGGKEDLLGIMFGSEGTNIGPDDGSITYKPGPVSFGNGRFVFSTGNGTSGVPDRLWVDEFNVTVNPRSSFTSTWFKVAGSEGNDNFFVCRTTRLQNRVSISNNGILGTDGLLHLIRGNLAGTISANATAQTIVIESSTNSGISFLGRDGRNQNIFFESISNKNNIFRFNHSTLRFQWLVDNIDVFTLSQTQATFNETAADIDFRIESLNNVNKFVINAGLDELLTGAGQADSALARIGGNLSVNNSAQGTTAVTTEETLLSYSLPASSLTQTGRGVRIKAWGNVANNTNTKQIKLKFGTHLLYDSTDLAAEDQEWYLEFEVFRTGAATQDAERHFSLGIVSGVGPGVTLIPAFQSPTETLSAAVLIEVTGQNGTANANDIVAEGLYVEFM